MGPNIRLALIMALIAMTIGAVDGYHVQIPVITDTTIAGSYTSYVTFTNSGTTQNVAIYMQNPSGTQLWTHTYNMAPWSSISFRPRDKIGTSFQGNIDAYGPSGALTGTATLVQNNGMAVSNIDAQIISTTISMTSLNATENMGR